MAELWSTLATLKAKMVLKKEILAKYTQNRLES